MRGFVGWFVDWLVRVWLLDGLFVIGLRGLWSLFRRLIGLGSWRLVGLLVGGGAGYNKSVSAVAAVGSLSGRLIAWRVGWWAVLCICVLGIGSWLLGPVKRNMLTRFVSAFASALATVNTKLDESCDDTESQGSVAAASVSILLRLEWVVAGARIQDWEQSHSMFSCLADLLACCFAAELCFMIFIHCCPANLLCVVVMSLCCCAGLVLCIVLLFCCSAGLLFRSSHVAVVLCHCCVVARRMQ